MRNYHPYTMFAVLLSMLCLISSPSFAEGISLLQARAQFDKAKHSEREAELYSNEADNQRLAHRAEVKQQQILEKSDVNRRAVLIKKLSNANSQKEKDELHHEIVALDKKLLGAINSRLEKGVQLALQLNHQRIKLRRAEEELMKAYQILLKTMRSSTPPILQSVEVTPEGGDIVYDVQWKDVQNREGNKEAAEDRRRALRQTLANLRLARDETKKKLDFFKDQRYRYVSDEEIAGMNLRTSISEHTDWNYLAIIMPAATEALGVIVEAYLSGGVSVLDGAITIITKVSLAAQDEIGNKHIGTFVDKLNKQLKKELGTPKKHATAKASLIGDNLEILGNTTVKGGVTWLAKKYPDLGKVIFQTKNISAKSFHQLMDWPDVGKSAALSEATAVLKAAVAEYFQNIANQAELRAFKAYYDHGVAQAVIDKSIQAERPYREYYKKSIAAIADTQRLLNEATPVWKRVKNRNLPLRDFQLDKPIHIALAFSQALSVPPNVSLGNQRLNFKAIGGLPGRNFVASSKIKRPGADGKYNLPLNVTLGSAEKVYKQLDANPATIPVLDSKNNSWSFLEGGKDASHTIEIINLKALIKELNDNAKEIKKYTTAMDKKLDYYHAPGFVKKLLTDAGVGWAVRYNDTWGKELVGNWQLSNISSRKYLLAHASAMTDSADTLRRSNSISNDEIKQLRDGMDSLRKFMPIVENSYLSCWPPFAIEQGLLWDKYKKLSDQAFAIPIVIGYDAEEVAALHKQANVFLDLGEKKGELATECLHVTDNMMKFPMFVSLEKYRKANKQEK